MGTSLRRGLAGGTLRPWPPALERAGPERIDAALEVAPRSVARRTSSTSSAWRTPDGAFEVAARDAHVRFAQVARGRDGDVRRRAALAASTRSPDRTRRTSGPSTRSARGVHPARADNSYPYGYDHLAQVFDHPDAPGPHRAAHRRRTTGATRAATSASTGRSASPRRARRSSPRAPASQMPRAGRRGMPARRRRAVASSSSSARDQQPWRHAGSSGQRRRRCLHDVVAEPGRRRPRRRVPPRRREPERPL